MQCISMPFFRNSAVLPGLLLIKFFCFLHILLQFSEMALLVVFELVDSSVFNHSSIF